MLKAVTSNYLTVLLEKSPGLKGKIVDLEIKSCGNDLVPVGQILC